MAMCVGLSFSLSLFLSLLSVSILHLGRARVLSPLLPPVAVPALSLACSGFRAACLCLSRCMSLSLALYVSVSRAVCLCLSRCMSLSLALYVSGGLCLSLLSCYYLATISLPSPGYLPGVCACEVYVNFSLKPACVRCVCGRGRGRGRVHRFPNNKELFCAILGNGSQLVGVCVGVLVLACLGVYSQVRSLLVREHIL
jgi:hypothetical protein